nr:F-box protein At5g49610-like [Ipomoea batatas]
MDSEFPLGQDMLFEILSLTTLETLNTCKVVSKELKELIEDSWFLQNYTLRTKNIMGYFVQTLQHNISFSTFVSIDPTLKIPNISIKCFGKDTRILASSNQGILCCQRAPNKNNYICEIFDSKIWSWRQTENLITERSTIFDHQSPVCTGGLVYWLTNRNTILAFDSATETHLEFAGPLAATEENRSYMYERIVEYKGRLGFICKYKSDELVLWGLEDRTNYRWEIKRVVGIDKEKNRLIGCNLADMALMLGYRDQVYAQSGFYNPRDIFPFQSNSEPVDLEDGCMLSCLEEMMNDC